ncbi:CLUMA_CG007030, isoform A [Clunio marinus]|uniref:CLUMA_CG007030, isoform A n=1 Tax=Clunio marinus TaxID=568069 RepID=A0A1J1I3Q4_9DIPT|nr:CLUMA_CG007030, isoform A [Clunio marinus]
MLERIVLVAVLLFYFKFAHISCFVNNINQLKAVKLTVESESDQKCQNELNEFINALDSRDEWAVTMFDTWAKIPSGLLQNNFQNIGHFTACVKFRKNLKDFDTLQGQHCMISFNAKTDSNVSAGDNLFDWNEVGDLFRKHQLSMNHGICLPASCSVKKVAEFSNQILSHADMVVINTTCKTNDSLSLTVVDIVAIIIFSIFGLLLIASTLYDIRQRSQKKEPHELFIAFSMYTNGERLFDMTESKSRHSIDCLNGLRAVSLLWIIVGHRTFNQLAVSYMNGKDFGQFMATIPSVFLAIFHIWVDTFFVMGGLLVTISFLNALDKKTVNIGRMYLHRYLRYTPVLAALILFTVSLMKFMAFGPLFDFEKNEPHCRTYWYWALLHVQNYAVANEQCLDFSWYLSVDFQMYIISPLLIYPIWKWGWKKCFWIFPFLIFLNQWCVFATVLKYELTPMVWDNNGSGGIIRWFLSLKQWKPIGRMGLSIYLTHRIYEMISILPQKQTLHFDFITVMHMFWGEVLITLAIASFLYLTFEAPFLLVESYIYERFFKKNSTS